MTKTSESGKIGEDIAAEYLIRNGFRVLERNFRRSWGEIDIVAKSKDNTLVFVEVKSMNEFGALRAEDHLTKTKLSRLKKICMFYATEHDSFINEKRGWQIDLIAIDLTKYKNNGEGNYLRHYENIT